MERGRNKRGPGDEGTVPGAVGIAFNALIVVVAMAAACAFVSIMLDGLNSSRLGAVLVSTTLLCAALFLRARRMRRAQERIVLVVCSLLLVETMLQVLAGTVRIPGLDVSNSLPFGRMYHSSEGFASSHNNRFGWYYPVSRFSTEATRRIALIGDSFIRGRHVPRPANVGAQLDRLLGGQAPLGNPGSVLSFGVSGAGPAEYLELMEYARRHYAPEELLVFLFLGNDFRNCLESADGDPRQSLAYSQEADGALHLRSESREYQASLQAELDRRHASLRVHLPRILKSYIMTRNVVRSLRKRIKERMRARGEEADEWARLGLDRLAFDQRGSEESRRAGRLMEGFLRQYRDFSDETGVDVTLVTIPAFPQSFYSTFAGKEWTSTYGETDLLRAERLVEDAAEELGLPVIAMGRRMEQEAPEVEEIRRLYLNNGTGHFSEHGHLFFAEALHQHLVDRK